MIIKNIKIFLQNIWKNNLIVNMILEICFKFDVVFIQEPSWSSICAILSSKSRDGKELVGIPNHPNWFIFMNSSSNIHDYPRVITYVNIRLFSFQFSLCKDILNHRDILLIFFFINKDIESLEIAINSFALAINRVWEKNSKIVIVSKHSKSWWDTNCNRDLEKYKSTRSLVD